MDSPRMSSFFPTCPEFLSTRVLWTARRSNRSILKEINHEYSSEGLMLKLKLQYSGHLMPRADSLEKPLTLGNSGGQRPGVLQSMGSQRVGHDLETEQQQKIVKLIKSRNGMVVPGNGEMYKWGFVKQWA